MDKYGLIGYPLGHSFSIGYFNEKFQNECIDATYENFEIPSIENLTEILDSNPELKGLNVTIPYKEKVISYLDSISPEARAIGAVNVIKVTHKGNKTELKGYNSDVIGFTQSIEPLLERYPRVQAPKLSSAASASRLRVRGGSIATISTRIPSAIKSATCSREIGRAHV